ncbi:MAG: alpha/beta fold hydrolase [Halococcoides sp.]
MPTTTRDGRTIRYATAGAGPTVAFVGDAGVGAWLWSAIQGKLTGPYQTLVWDGPGIGESDMGPISIATLRKDLATVLRESGAEQAHLIGVGLGGVVALESARREDRVQSVIALGTVVDPDLGDLWAPPDDHDALEAATRAHLGTDPPADWLNRIVAWRAADDACEAAYEQYREAWETATLADPYEITTPALLGGGVADRVAPVDAVGDLAADLPRGEYREFAGGHLFPVARGRAVADVAIEWLTAHSDREFDRRSGDF